MELLIAEYFATFLQQHQQSFILSIILIVLFMVILLIMIKLFSSIVKRDPSMNHGKSNMSLIDENDSSFFYSKSIVFNSV